VKVLEMGVPDGAGFFTQLQTLKADLFVVISFGKILKKSYLELPKFGALNVHASLLPKYRGASPMQSAILNGESETGVCVMRMVETLDAGAVSVTKKTTLHDRETILTLEPKLSVLASQALMESLAPIESSKARWVEQDASQATVCVKIKKENGKLDWNLSARQLDRQVRAYLDWPGSYAFYKGKRLVVKKSRPETSPPALKPGQIVSVLPEAIAVSTSDGCLFLEEIQLEGRSALKASEFLKGTPLKTGELLE
jgi:methionyl-tRNA formyltransferase